MMAIRSFAHAVDLGCCQNPAKINFMHVLRYIVLHYSLYIALSASVESLVRQIMSYNDFST